MFRRSIISTGLMLSASIMMSACTHTSAVNPSSQQLFTPASWSKQVSENIDNSWLTSLQSVELAQLVKQAIVNNQSLLGQYHQLQISKLNVNSIDANLWPKLTGNVSSGRRQTANSPNSYSTNFELGLSASYEVDIWGKLSADAKSAALNYAAAQADFSANIQTLVANVSKAWFNLAEAQHLLALYQQRLANLKRNLINIERSYQLGLGSALDVYLSKNTVHQEEARLAQQQQTVLQVAQNIQVLTGQYPNGLLEETVEFPLITSDIKAGIPSDLVTRRPDINAQWLKLLSSDESLAVAHKQRFPKLALTASAGNSSDSLSELVKGNNVLWSLLANLTSPIFDAGKLKTAELQAKHRVAQQEKVYLNSVLNAFADVEKLINNHYALIKRYTLLQSATENAEIAEKLSFEQYQKGLVSYTTVLDSERRAFDARSSVIQLQNQLLQNKVSLHLALGGDFDTNQDALSAIESREKI